MPNSSTAIISFMAGSTTTQQQQKVDAATTAVHIHVTIKEMVAAAAAGREIVEIVEIVIVREER